MKRNICVFCSSSERIDSDFFEAARNLAGQIAKHDDRLIYGGAKIGLMGQLARSVLERGAAVTGIIPRKIHDFGLGLKEVDEYLVTTDMAARKKLLIEKGDVFVVLPGGFGTLEEVMEVLTLKQLGYHNKAVIFINTNGFFDPLLKYFDSIYAAKFAKEEYRHLYFIAENSQQAFVFLESYNPLSSVTKWD